MPENTTAAPAPPPGALVAAPTPVNPQPAPQPPPATHPVVDAMPDGAPDAVLCPRDANLLDRLLNTPGGINFRKFPHYGYRDRYGPLLYKDLPGRKQVVYARPQGTQHVLTRDTEGLLFPLGDPRESQERHAWWVVQESPTSPPLVPPRRVWSFRDNPGAILFGFLRDPDALVATDGGTARVFRAATAGQLQEYRMKHDRWEALVARHALSGGHLSPEEVGEVIELGAYFDRVKHEGFEDPFRRA